MPKPKFIFTKYKTSFVVKIENLEQLEVSQIQEIQDFVAKRKGVFDFNTYSFSIQKRLEFREFIHLLESVSLDALCSEKVLKVKNQARVEFGKYKGMLFAEVPDSYLLWLKASYMGKDRDIIDIELSNRNL